MEHKNLYRVPITLTVNNAGFYRYVKTEISCLAENESDALQKVKEQLTITPSLDGAYLVHDFKHLDTEE